MKNVGQIINTLDIATKEYADGKAPTTTTNIQKEYLQSHVNEWWQTHTFMFDERIIQTEIAIEDEGVWFTNIFQVGAIFLTTDPDFDPNNHFFWWAWYHRDGVTPWVNDNWTQLEDVITLKQKNDPTKEVTIYAWQRTS